MRTLLPWYDPVGEEEEEVEDKEEESKQQQQQQQEEEVYYDATEVFPSNTNRLSFSNSFFPESWKLMYEVQMCVRNIQVIAYETENKRPVDFDACSEWLNSSSQFALNDLIESKEYLNCVLFRIRNLKFDLSTKYNRHCEASLRNR